MVKYGNKAGSRQQAAGSRQQAAGSRQQAAGSRQQAAGSRQQAAGSTLNFNKTVINDNGGVNTSSFNSHSLSNFHSHIIQSPSTNRSLSATALISGIYARLSHLKRVVKSIVLILPCLVWSDFTIGALSAQTAHTIQGRHPYIEVNGETLTDLSHFLSIKIGDNTYISNASGNMKKVNSDGTLTVIPAGTAISLASVAAQFDSVTTIVPADMGSYNLSSIVPDDVRKDDDEDNTFTLVGNVVGEWKDKNGMSIGSELTAIPNDCLAPYTLTFTIGSPSLSTQYGDPHTTAYDNTSAIFTIVPVSQAGICFAKPNMNYSTGQYAGPSNMWDTSNGFKLQSIIPSSYSSNFPTTGANNLYFDLDIAGVSSALDWPSVTVGMAPNAITATMTSISATGLRVTLTGPVANSSSTGATADAPPTLPARFELVGYSGSTAVVKYGFELQKWFINRGFNWQAAIGTNSQTAWCSGLNGSHYAIVKVKDLTNASGVFVDTNNATIPGATPASSGNYYQRRIGGGLFSEWGAMTNYSGAAFSSFYYWTGDAEESGAFQFSVMSTDGEVFADSPYGSLMGICTQP